MVYKKASVSFPRKFSDRKKMPPPAASPSIGRKPIVEEDFAPRLKSETGMNAPAGQERSRAQQPKMDAGSVQRMERAEVLGHHLANFIGQTNGKERPNVRGTVASGKRVVQAARHKNKTTNKTYEVTVGKGRIDAEEVDGDSYGYITYDFDEFIAVLKHIESHPEEGSGLGSLLTFLFAMETAKRNIPGIVVSAPATTALGFYKKMGFDVERRQEEVRKKYREVGREEDIPKEVTISETSANVVMVSMNASASFFKHWEKA